MICALCVLVGGCKKFDATDIWENINSLDKRVTALEKLCKEMNTNITALQTLVNALEKNDYITNVSPVKNGDEVIGYTISFVYSDPITIYHGEDGKDGITPQLKIEDDYWYVSYDNGKTWTMLGPTVGAQGPQGETGPQGVRDFTLGYFWPPHHITT